MVEKRTLIIGGIAAVLLVAIIFIAVVLAVFFSFRGLYQDSVAAKAAGRKFAETTDQRGCMAEGLKRARLTTKSDIFKLVENGDFVEGCLEASPFVEGFCDNVPRFRDSREGQWEYAKCRESKMDSQTTGCKSIYEEQLMYCERRARAGK